MEILLKEILDQYVDYTLLFYDEHCLSEHSFFIKMNAIKDILFYLNNMYNDIDYVVIIEHLKKFVLINIDTIVSNENVKLYLISYTNYNIILLLEHDRILFLGNLYRYYKENDFSETYFVHEKQHYYNIHIYLSLNDKKYITFVNDKVIKEFIV
jgi:hypothetical protein